MVSWSIVESIIGSIEILSIAAETEAVMDNVVLEVEPLVSSNRDAAAIMRPDASSSPGSEIVAKAASVRSVSASGIAGFGASSAKSARVARMVEPQPVSGV